MNIKKSKILETINDVVELVTGKKNLASLGAAEITPWLEKLCDCTLPESTGNSSQIMAISNGPAPRRCTRCWGLFNAHATEFKTAPYRGRELEIFELGIKAIDDECRAVCDCHALKIDKTKSYRIGEVIRCGNCGRVAGKIGLEE
jgi:hypothetical protein